MPDSTLNPYQIWWAVVVVAGLSFFGYIAMRLGGADLGIVMTGLFGGLASSTSTTLALARLVRTQDTLAPFAAAGVVIAGSVTFLRIMLLVAFFQPALIAPLAMPMGIMAGVGFAGAVIIRIVARSKVEAPHEMQGIVNPLELKTAFSFGVLLTVVVLGVHFLQEWIGTRGVYAAAALSGVTDVDALTISVSKLVGDDLAAASGASAIFIAVSVNTAVKAGISMAIGGASLGLRVLFVYAAVILAGGGSLWLGSLTG